MTTLVDVILEIKTLKETLSTLDKTSDKYLELNNNYQKLLSFKEHIISNMELAVNGSQLQEALGSWETSYLMYDSDDHNHKDGLKWYGIPTVRAGKKDKNHKDIGKWGGKVLISQVRPSPFITMLTSMRKIHPQFTSGTQLQQDKNKEERKQNKSASSSVLINHDNISRVSKSSKGVIE